MSSLGRGLVADGFHDLDTVDKARLVAYAQGLSDKSLKD